MRHSVLRASYTFPPKHGESAAVGVRLTDGPVREAQMHAGGDCAANETRALKRPPERRAARVPKRVSRTVLSATAQPVTFRGAAHVRAAEGDGNFVPTRHEEHSAHLHLAARQQVACTRARRACRL